MPADYLHNHPEFSDLLRIVAEDQSINPTLVEKDYWIMHCLYGLQQLGLKFELKGGTSLSKGLKIIDRFSEDIDIFLDPASFQPPLGKNAIDRELKNLRDAVGQHPALTFVNDESQTIGGFGRNDRRRVDGGSGKTLCAFYVRADHRAWTDQTRARRFGAQ